jgi:hypothetical protein
MPHLLWGIKTVFSPGGGYPLHDHPLSSLRPASNDWRPQEHRMSSAWQQRFSCGLTDWWPSA